MKSLIFLFSLLPIIADAAEWAMDANIKQDFSYNDNVTMSEKAESSMVFELTPVINTSRKTQNTELATSASYGFQRYSDIPALDREKQNYILKASYKTEMTAYSVSSNYNIAPARNSAESDSGNFASAAEKTSLTVSPTISYKLTERDTLSLSVNYSDTSYSTTEFADTVNSSISVAWQQQWTVRYSGSVSAFFLQYDSTGATLETSSNSYGINISTRYLLTENWEISSNIGARLTDSVNKQQTNFGFFTTENQSEGFLSDTGFIYHGESLTAILNFNRSLTPSGSGQLNEQSRVALSLDYKLTERLFVALAASYQSSQSASSNESNKRTNITFQPRISWKMTPDLVLSGQYRYRQQDESNKNKPVDSNTFMLVLDYNWAGLSLAR